MADRDVRWQFSHHPGESGPGWEVEAGPFTGLRYPGGLRTVSEAEAKRRGEYEADLAGHLVEVLAAPPVSFHDIGAAEGYYAVGIARRGIPTTAYESSAIQRSALQRVAAANGVGLSLRRHCRRLPAPAPGSLVMMDVEGAEGVLICDGDAGRLAGSTLIVELHDVFAPSVTERVRAALEPTHRAEILDSSERDGLARWGVFRPR
ncbi:MAG TPA: hypothetical protein VH476_09035 [Solirubrobacterales bacterium]